MRLLKIIIFLLAVIPLLGQDKKVYPMLNLPDSTITFTKKQTIDMARNKERIKLLGNEIIILNTIGGKKDLLIGKLMLKDSLNTLHIDKYEQMEEVMMSTLDRYKDVTNNYKILLFSADDKQKILQDNIRNERRWKNLYKFGIPTLAVGILILTR